MSNENKQLTLLEKFEQGWEIRHKSEIKAVQVIKRKEGVGYIIEWEGGGAFCYIGNESYITCTPPKERKTVYVYLLTITGKCLTSEELLTSEFCKIIQTIHLEKNGDKWEVVNP